MSTWKRVLVEDDAVGTNGLGISAVDGDNTDEEKIRLSDGTNNDDVVLEAGTGLSIARDGDKITFTNTVSDTNTMGSGFSIGVDTNSNATTIVEGETLTFTGGTGISTETTADGTVTITNTVSNTDTVNMGDGFIVTADTNSNATTIVENETLTIAGGTGISTETTADGTVTITSTVTDTNTQNSYAISCVDGDNTDEEKIRLTQSGAGGAATDDIVLEAGTGLSVARDGDKITFTNTVSDTNTMGSGFSIGADTDSNATTIVEGETLTIAGGTGITTETTADGTVTITNSISNTDVDVSNANLLTRLAALESAGGAANQNITIGADSGDTIVITGNLQVDGTTTTVNSTTLTVDDKNIVIASGAANAAGINGAGITVDATTNSITGYTADPQLQWNSTHTAFSQWKMVKGVSGETDSFIAGMVTAADFDALNILTPGVGTFAMISGVPYIQTA
tara:strand:- start:31445 stop:32806 length:1362 start_codon:yes stop_codon:yes gene_type:complete